MNKISFHAHEQKHLAKNKISGIMQYAIIWVLFSVFMYSEHTYASTTNTDLTDLKTYVSSLVKNAFDVLNDKNLNASSKEIKVRKMIGENLDIDKMTNFVLGMNKRSLSPDQYSKFKEEFRHYIVAFYSQIVRLYDGQKIDIINVSEQNPNEYLVKVVVTKNDSDKQISVNYMVDKPSSGFKVFDVITESYSLLNNHRGLFNDFMQNGGFERLMSELKSLESGLNNNGNSKS